MSLTRKQIVALADLARSMRHRERVKLADFCEAHNPRFKRERFMAYIRGECGPRGGSIRRQRRTRRPRQPRELVLTPDGRLV